MHFTNKKNLRSSQDITSAFEAGLKEFFVESTEVDSINAMSVVDFGGQFKSEGSKVRHRQEYLSFKLANELYAVNIQHIKEIIKVPSVTSIPRSDTPMMGVLSLRGNIVPVLDLCRVLGLTSSEKTSKSRVLIVEKDEEFAGALVDVVRDVIRLNEDEIQLPPPVFRKIETKHLLGIGRSQGETYTLLDIHSVIQIKQYIR